MMELDGINYEFGMRFTNSDKDSVSVVIVNTFSNKMLRSGYFFGIRYDGIIKFPSINWEFGFDRDETSHGTVKITGVDEVE